MVHLPCPIIEGEALPGPYHVLTQIRILKSLPQEVLQLKQVKSIPTEHYIIILVILKHIFFCEGHRDSYIQTGVWYAHSECVLLSLLGSEVAEDRSFATQCILKMRGEDKLGDLSVRDRVTPRLNLEPPP